MGKVMTKMTLTNPADVLARRRRARAVRIEGLVDTGATTLVLPREVCRRLGLRLLGTRRVRYANGKTARVPWTVVRVGILGRETFCEALVEAPGTTPLIGQIPLEGLDLVVDPKSRQLRANPASPDAPLFDILGDILAAA
jgi:clan AA aspartic protease